MSQGLAGMGTRQAMVYMIASIKSDHAAVMPQYPVGRAAIVSSAIVAASKCTGEEKTGRRYMKVPYGEMRDNDGVM